MSIGQINLLPVGKLVTRATNDPNNISDMFTNTIVNLIRNFVAILITGIILFSIHWLMALIVIPSIIILVVASSIFRKFSRKAYRTVRNNVSEINVLSENLSGTNIVQVFNQEKKKKKNWKLLQ